MGVSRTLTILLCVSVLMSTPVGAVSLVPLAVPPIDGDTSSVSSAPWVTIESHRLTVSNGSASGMLVNVTNFNQSADRSGEMRARLLTLDGAVVAAANKTVYVTKKGKDGQLRPDVRRAGGAIGVRHRPGHRRHLGGRGQAERRLSVDRPGRRPARRWAIEATAGRDHHRAGDGPAVTCPPSASVGRRERTRAGRWSGRPHPLSRPALVTA